MYLGSRQHCALVRLKVVIVTLFEGLLLLLLLLLSNIIFPNFEVRVIADLDEPPRPRLAMFDYQMTGDPVTSVKPELGV